MSTMFLRRFLLQESCTRIIEYSLGNFLYSRIIPDEVAVSTSVIVAITLIALVVGSLITGFGAKMFHSSISKIKNIILFF